MDTDEHRSEILNEISSAIIGAAFEVSALLGSGFLEKVYERALAEELLMRGLKVRQQVGYSVLYKERPVGKYLADLVVADRILVELKCVEHLMGEHMAQCLNYLKASGLRMALLFNFQRPKIEWKRIING